MTDVLEAAEGPYTLEITEDDGTIRTGRFDDWRVACNAKRPALIQEWCVRTANGTRVWPPRSICDVLRLCEGPYEVQGWAPGWYDIAGSTFWEIRDAYDEATIGYPGDVTRIVTASGHVFWEK